LLVGILTYLTLSLLTDRAATANVSLCTGPLIGNSSQMGSSRTITFQMKEEQGKGKKVKQQSPYCAVSIFLMLVALDTGVRAQNGNCDEEFLKANAVFTRAMAYCKRDYLDSPAGYYALNKSRECSDIAEVKLRSIAMAAFKEFDNVRKQHGVKAACEWVDGIERSVLEYRGN